MKFLAAGLVLILVLLQYRLWLGDGGMREVHRLRAEIEVQKDQNRELKERNRTLAAEVQDLKKGTVAIEERARTDLGMVGRGETFYQVVEPNKAPAEPAPNASAEEPEESGGASRGGRSPASVIQARRPNEN
ncbi:cell division protein FtsB [Steroidobacter sp.]|uniref:cell division protein FtsB n=1 Tax=Steroidobacter sp. TaxID=1978227 RepID=UPI001A371098|nr:cell division protein FtsB [Steroidobacter sp.]MBL8269607.1 cell division protein FtsB [Steroidobacter sp.]